MKLTDTDENDIKNKGVASAFVDTFFCGYNADCERFLMTYSARL